MFVPLLDGCTRWRQWEGSTLSSNSVRNDCLHVAVSTVVYLISLQPFLSTHRPHHPAEAPRLPGPELVEQHEEAERRPAEHPLHHAQDHRRRARQVGSTGSSSDVLALFSLIFVLIATNLCVTCTLHCRGNKLEDVGEISKNLASESKKYNWGAKQLSAMVSVGAY